MITQIQNLKQKNLFFLLPYIISFLKFIQKLIHGLYQGALKTTGGKLVEVSLGCTSIECMNRQFIVSAFVL